MISLIFEFSFLLGIHIMRGIIYYLIIHTAFTFISLGFVYMYEFMTRKFYYSFLKLEKENYYFLETLEFFNIAYFSTRNKSVKKTIKMDFVMSHNNNEDMNESYVNDAIPLKSIERVMKNLISIECFCKEIENYLIISRNKKNFKFKKLIKILVSNEDNKHHFKKFTNVGILCLKNNQGEESFLKLFLKIKTKKIRKMTNDSDMELEDKALIKNYYVGIEGIFFDVTQSFIKKETQLNSIVLSKYINDIKSPLYLLQQIVNKFKYHMLNVSNFSNSENHNKSINKFNSLNHEFEELSNDLRIVSININENIELINNFAREKNNPNN